MQGYVILVSLTAMILGVALRSAQLKKLGIKAVHFGEMDKKDFIIPPFVLLYFYLILANVFHWPSFDTVFTANAFTPWLGAALCAFAPIMFYWGLHSFGKSFRVGLDEGEPGKLISGGAFAVTRNPLYIAFFAMLLGVFLIFSTWVFFAYLVVGLWRVDRQVGLEENSLRKVYGQEYNDYCEKVRRYL